MRGCLFVSEQLSPATASVGSTTTNSKRILSLCILERKGLFPPQTQKKVKVYPLSPLSVLSVPGDPGSNLCLLADMPRENSERAKRAKSSLSVFPGSLPSATNTPRAAARGAPAERRRRPPELQYQPAGDRFSVIFVFLV